MNKEIYLSYPRNSYIERYAIELRDELNILRFNVFDFLDGINPGGQYLNSIHKQISKCDIFVGFINNDSPSVYLELGIAIARQKTVIIVGTQNTEIPVFLKDFRFVECSTQGWIYNVTSHICQLADKILSEKRDNNESTLLNEMRPPEIILKEIYDKKELLEEISPNDFEMLLRQWFEKQGYHIQNVNAFGVSGCDFLVRDNKDDLLAVEVKKKNYNSNVSMMDVQKLLNAMHYNKANGAILISSSNFTNSASYFAESCDPPIQLWGIGNLVNKDNV